MLCGAKELATLFRDRMFFFDTVLHLSVNAAADQREGGKSGASRSSHLSSVIRSCRPTCECKGTEVCSCMERIFDNSLILQGGVVCSCACQQQVQWQQQKSVRSSPLRRNGCILIQLLNVILLGAGGDK